MAEAAREMGDRGVHSDHKVQRGHQPGSGLEAGQLVPHIAQRGPRCQGGLVAAADLRLQADPPRIDC